MKTRSRDGLAAKGLLCIKKIFNYTNCVCLFNLHVYQYSLGNILSVVTCVIKRTIEDMINHRSYTQLFKA